MIKGFGHEFAHAHLNNPVPRTTETAERAKTPRSFKGPDG
jgi:hypothetical protein